MRFFSWRVRCDETRGSWRAGKSRRQIPRGSARAGCRRCQRITRGCWTFSAVSGAEQTAEKNFLTFFYYVLNWINRFVFTQFNNKSTKMTFPDTQILIDLLIEIDSAGDEGKKHNEMDLSNPDRLKHLEYLKQLRANNKRPLLQHNDRPVILLGSDENENNKKKERIKKQEIIYRITVEGKTYLLESYTKNEIMILRNKEVRIALRAFYISFASLFICVVDKKFIFEFYDLCHFLSFIVLSLLGF
jgi:hypothetical protein